jgi:hypothetical protein
MWRLGVTVVGRGQAKPQSAKAYDADPVASFKFLCAGPAGSGCPRRLPSTLPECGASACRFRVYLATRLPGGNLSRTQSINIPLKNIHHSNLQFIHRSCFVENHDFLLAELFKISGRRPQEDSIAMRVYIVGNHHAYGKLKITSHHHCVCITKIERLSHMTVLLPREHSIKKMGWK